MPRPAFSFTLHGTIAYPPGSSFPLRLMPDHEVVWIIDGQATWIVGKRRVPTPPGTVILVPPGTRDAFDWDPVATTRHAYVHFTIEHLGDLPHPSTWPEVNQLSVGDVVRPLLAQVLGLLECRPDGWQGLADAALAHAIRSLCAGQAGGTVLAALPEPLHNMLHFVALRWRGDEWLPLNLGELARKSGVSRVHLCRLMHAVCGRGVLAALRDLRLDRAAKLLQRSDLSIGEIARRAGFADAFHFSRRFRTRFGMSPRAWRQEPRVIPPEPGLSSLATWLQL